MIVHPDFLDHWKTTLLVNQLDDKAAPLLLIRLWGHCQTRRRHVFENITPEMVKAVCHWAGDGRQLLDALTNCRFIEVNGDTMTVHDWEKVNASLLTSWVNGRSGGRPPKSRKQPTGNPPVLRRQAGADPTGNRGEAAACGQTLEEAERFWNFWQERGWNRSDGAPVDWKRNLRTWTPKGPAGPARRQAANARGQRPRWQIRKDIEASEKRIEELTRETGSWRDQFGVDHAGDKPTPEARAKIKAERARLVKLQAEFDNADDPEASSSP